MKLKIALIFILFILITVLTFGAVVNADEFIIKPEKVNYYDSIYSATPGGSSFFDPDKTYNSFFSPYAVSKYTMNVHFEINFGLYFNFDGLYSSDGNFTDSQLKSLNQSVMDQFYMDSLDSLITDLDYDFRLNSIYPNYTTKKLEFSYFLSGSYALTSTTGSLGFYSVSDYEIYGPGIKLGYLNSTIDSTYCSIFALEGYYVSSGSYVHTVYNFPYPVTATDFVFVNEISIDGRTDTINSESKVKSTLYLNNLFLYNDYTVGKIGGVFNFQYSEKLNNSVFDFYLQSSSFYNAHSDISNNSELIISINSGKLLFYSEDIIYSGGENYGDWTSNNCDWYDIPCHLGNAIGYLVYEFPLTKPITTLFSGLVGYLDAFFDISSEFSDVEVIYGVVITMIAVAIIVALIK